MSSTRTRSHSIRISNECSEYFKEKPLNRIVESLMEMFKDGTAYYDEDTSHLFVRRSDDESYFIKELQMDIILLKHDLEKFEKLQKRYAGHFVYKYVLNDEVIYVGKTDVNLSKRLSDHGKSGDNIPKEGWEDIRKAKIYFCKLLSKRDTDIYESELIRRYRPKYNKAKMEEWDGVDLPEPNWTEFDGSSEYGSISYTVDRLCELQRKNFELHCKNQEMESRLKYLEQFASSMSGKFKDRLKKQLIEFINQTDLGKSDAEEVLEAKMPNFNNIL